MTPTPVRINADRASGTGGLEIDAGGTVPVKVASIDGHGIVTASGFRTGQTTNSDMAGQMMLASGTASRIFTGTYATAPICVASDITSTSPVRLTISARPFTMTLTGTGDGHGKLHMLWLAVIRFSRGQADVTAFTLCARSDP